MSEVLDPEPIYKTSDVPADRMPFHTRERVFNILEVDSDSNNIIFCDENGKKVAIITYRLDTVNGDKICHISFFGTQNGIGEDYSKLNFLDSGVKKIKGISYTVMFEFIQQYCFPRQIKRIYLDADIGTIYPGSSLSRKDFWKLKMGKFLKNEGIITRTYSQGTELCFELKD